MKKLNINKLKTEEKFICIKDVSYTRVDEICEIKYIDKKDNSVLLIESDTKYNVQWFSVGKGRFEDLHEYFKRTR